MINEVLHEELNSLIEEVQSGIRVIESYIKEIQEITRETQTRIDDIYDLINLAKKRKDEVYGELDYKINEVIEYLKDNNGYNYKVYNHTCPTYSDEPDSNIVEYAEEVKDLINKIFYPEDMNDIKMYQKLDIESLPFI